MQCNKKNLLQIKLKKTKGNSRKTRPENNNQDLVRMGGEGDLVFVDIEAAELLVLPFAGDRERARNELV